MKTIKNVKSYKLIKCRNEINTKYMTEKEVKERYSYINISIIINILKNIFEYDKFSNVALISINGYINSFDLSNGSPMKECIMSLNTNKNAFINIDLYKINPVYCFEKELKGQFISHKNNDLIIPHKTCNRDIKVIHKIEQINLLNVDTFEFEDIIVDLLNFMGYETEGTKRTRDNAIDCIIYNRDEITGGKIVGQFKRYKNNIEIAKLREFESALRKENAIKGIL